MVRPKRKATEAAAMEAKKARGETDLSDGLKWHQAGEEIKGVNPVIVLSSDTLAGSQKIAGFDIDFTVIRTASGRKFARGSKDWTWWNDSVPEKLKAINKDGYRVVFFTNQAGIEKQKVKPREVMTKIEDIISQLGIPVIALICTGNNHFRKPSTMMWDYFLENCNGGVKVDLTKCYYIGDAAGRAKEWAAGKPRDFSCGDRMFAANIGIDFKTPEEYFLGEASAPFKWCSVDPDKVLSDAPKPPAKKQEYHVKGKEIVILVGAPASGKSTFRKRYLEPYGYLAVNRDTMGTMAKCLKAAKDALKEGKSVVVDNTNPSMSARSDFLDLASKTGCPCRCFVMNTPIEVAHHMNMVRQNQTNGQVRRVPEVGYNVYKKNFQEPTIEEGFTEVLKIDFVPEFGSSRDEQLFRQWTFFG
ncbi:bifunctional polynucleotide phosphatase/kinase-like [Liolophura sinensis]|uniref:bifunctional polynucleotide phosphatase/kinase-like n=1 Tax=Liolophura sinensis TaxID=3198878 RepID=UPI003158A78D